MRRIGFSMVLALVGACAPLLLPQSIAAADVLGPSQPQPTSTPECDPARVDPVVALEFQPRIARAGQAVSARVEFRNYNAYAVELLLSQPGYGTRFYDWTGSYQSTVVLQIPAPEAQGDWSAYVRSRGEGMMCSNGHYWFEYRTVESQRPVTLTVSGSTLWLPFAQEDSASLADRYLFVERWLTSDFGPGCEPIHIDRFGYRFVPASGYLRVWSADTLRLEESDFGYYGAGTQMSGMGAGEGSGLSRMVNLPFKGDDLVIVSADEWGAIAVDFEGETIDLAPGSERRWQSVESDYPPCVVTTTHRISNFGYQDRSKIDYRY